MPDETAAPPKSRDELDAMREAAFEAIQQWIAEENRAGTQPHEIMKQLSQMAVG